MISRNTPVSVAITAHSRAKAFPLETGIINNHTWLGDISRYCSGTCLSHPEMIAAKTLVGRLRSTAARRSSSSRHPSWPAAQPEPAHPQQLAPVYWLLAVNNPQHDMLLKLNHSLKFD